MIEDVPSPIDFRDKVDAKEWESTAMDRPFRLEFFDQFLLELKKLNKPTLNVLELGSGPGFLARHLLNRLPNFTLTLLDFSSAMHELAYDRLKDHLNRVTFIKKSFKDTHWANDLGQFDAVITNQAVHELRHKSYAQALHEQVKPLLNISGVYLVCDHYLEFGSQKNDQLYMNLEEHTNSLHNAGYKTHEVLVKGGRVLNRAT